MANSKAKTHQRIENNCHISEIVEAFPYVENCELNLVL